MTKMEMMNANMVQMNVVLIKYLIVLNNTTVKDPQQFLITPTLIVIHITFPDSGKDHTTHPNIVFNLSNKKNYLL